MPGMHMGCSVLYRIVKSIFDCDSLLMAHANAARYKEECLGEIIRNLQSSRAAQKMTEMTEEERAWLLVKMVCLEDVRTQKILSEALWL